MSDLSQAELRRYARHLSLPGFGRDGQERLRDGSVLCVGAGGLGAPALLYLAAAGVGRIGVIDPDVVDETNLQRQVLFTSADCGVNKAQAAAVRLAALNPFPRIDVYQEAFTEANALELASSYDVLMDGTDNFPTRYLCNDAAFFAKKPNAHASIFRFDGQCSVFAPHLGAPCYRCLFPTPPVPGTVPDCASGGVLGVLPGLLGTMQALQVIEFLAKIGDPLLGRLLHVDALSLKFREIKLRRDPQCPLCGSSPTIHKVKEIFFSCSTTSPPMNAKLSAKELRDLLAQQKIHLVDVREPWEYEICHVSPSQLVPLSELPERFEEIPRDQAVAVMCRAGVRSAKAIAFLESQGFSNLTNVVGGIDSWRASVEPGLADY